MTDVKKSPDGRVDLKVTSIVCTAPTPTPTPTLPLSASDLWFVLDMDGTLISEHSDSDDRSSSTKVHARPYLFEFLSTLFRVCQGRVGLWTAAGKGWYECVYRSVLQPVLAQIPDYCTCSTSSTVVSGSGGSGGGGGGTGSSSSPQHARFAFTWFSDRCSHANSTSSDWSGDSDYSSGGSSSAFNSMYSPTAKKLKKLSKIWRRRSQRPISCGGGGVTGTLKPTIRLTRHNVVIVDDTPITYAVNYGNAVPVPTFTGRGGGGSGARTLVATDEKTGGGDDSDSDDSTSDDCLLQISKALSTRWLPAYYSQSAVLAKLLFGADTDTPSKLIELIHGYAAIRSIRLVHKHLDYWNTNNKH